MLARSIAALALAAAAVPAAAQSISIMPAFGGSKISTPWGDFVAIPEGRSGMWIGTVEQYMNGKADAVAARSGMRAVQIEGQGDGGRTYVGSGPDTQVGATRIYDISTILFPTGPEVVVAWTASNKVPVGQRIFTADGKRAFTPRSCDGDSCTYVLPDAALTVPLTYVFFRKGAAPGVVTIPSAATEEFRQLQAGPANETSRAVQQRLHGLDSSIPAPAR